MADAVQAFRQAVQAALGYVPDVVKPGQLHRFATSDRHGDSAGWCLIFEDGRAGVFGDWRGCSTRTWTLADTATLTRRERVALARRVAAAVAERQRVQRAEWAANGARIARLWAQCVPLVPGDPATLYLKRRGLAGVWPLPTCLRLHPALPYWSGPKRVGEFPALVAQVVATGGRVVALHRTYLRADGRKAGVPTVKKLTGTAGPLAGGCIPLHEPARGVIGVAEGIETALAAWCASTVPTVAACSAGGLAAWQWPVGVSCVEIFADNDRAGLDAADRLAGRVRAAGLGCGLHVPSGAGTDWCDVWAARDRMEGAGS